jgi:hypothetical protein
MTDDKKPNKSFGVVKSTKLIPVPVTGHKDKFAPPSKGWPTFGPDGKVQRDK